MKYVIFLGDGMADYPIESLDGKTPLGVASTPNIDNLAKKGRCGLFKTLPEGMPAGSAVANLSVMGYDPRECFEGRGVLEAANQGVDIGEGVAMRCNLICVENGRIKNHSAGHISTEEAKELISALNEKLGGEKVKFYPGVSYRHLLVINGDEFSSVEGVPPHDIPGKEIEEVIIKGDDATSSFLYDLSSKAQEILENHPVNVKRAAEGKDKASHVWFWSAGRKPKMKKYVDLYGKKGAVISAVDLINGIGVYAGFDVITVQGATGLYDTNYEGKADAVIDALKDHDFVYCHVEASDEAGHEGDFELKVKTIEYLDKRLIGRVLGKLEEIGDIKGAVSIAVLPDHFTPCVKKTHTCEEVPFLIYNPNVSGDTVEGYTEESCKKGSFGTLKGDEFIKKFFE